MAALFFGWHPSCEKRAPMNRRILLKSAGFTAFGLPFPGAASAEDNAKAGKLGAEDFQRIHSEAGAKVKASKPDTETLSDGDRKLVEQIALPGWRP